MKAVHGQVDGEGGIVIFRFLTMKLIQTFGNKLCNGTFASAWYASNSYEDSVGPGGLGVVVCEQSTNAKRPRQHVLTP